MVIGCDPGLTGAISLIHRGELLECYDIPTCDNGQATGSMKRWVDIKALRAEIGFWSIRHDFAREVVAGVIERPIPMPSLPAQTIASQFDTFGVLRAVLDSQLRDSVHAVSPNVWKKFFGLRSDKEAARSTAMSLYPGAPIKRMKDHNRAESILIAHWFARTGT
jgi:hypothetical protein